MASPFLILAHEGNSYWVELSNFIKIHSVFSSDRLHKAADNSLPGQRNEPLPPIVVTGDQEYEVQEIIATKTIRGNLHYRASWIGYNEDLEWYPADNFKYSPHLLKQFHLANSEQPGLSTGLQSWLQAYEDGREKYEELKGDKPVSTRLRASFFERERWCDSSGEDSPCGWLSWLTRALALVNTGRYLVLLALTPFFLL